MNKNYPLSNEKDLSKAMNILKDLTTKIICYHRRMDLI